MSAPRVAFVVPRYGPQIVGGAETLARGLAEHARAAGVAEVEVLTSCASDHQAWANDLPEGRQEINGVPVRRFRMAHPRSDADRWHAIHERLIFGRPVTADEQYEWVDRGGHSPDLYRYLWQRGRAYDFLIFIPYLFGTTYYGALIHPERAILAPCLHDELYAYLGPTRDMFASGRGVMFNTDAERRLAERLYGSHPGAQVVGVGVEPLPAEAARFRRRHGLAGPYILYAGRTEGPKNLNLLTHYFVRYKQRRGGALSLAVIGGGDRSQIPRRDDIRVLGFQPEQDKWDAYAGASLLCMPSIKESFSIVIMEAWLAGAPVLVHADCEVTRDHVARSDGGLYFREYGEFEAALDLMLGNEPLRRRMAERGAAYVQREYGWPAVMARFQAALEYWAAVSAPRQGTYNL